MLTFTIRRLLLSIPTLLFISLVIFLLLQLAPGDPMAQVPLTVPPEVKQKMREALGLGAWIAALLASRLFAQPVADMLTGYIEHPDIRLVLAFILVIFVVVMLCGIVIRVMHAAIDRMAPHGRVVLCGQLSAYDSNSPAAGPRDMMKLV